MAKNPPQAGGKERSPPPTHHDKISIPWRPRHPSSPQVFSIFKTKGALSPCPRPAASLTTQGPCDGRKREWEGDTHTTALGEGLASSKGSLSCPPIALTSPPLIPSPPITSPQVATAPSKYKGHGSQQSPKTLGKKPPWHEIKKTQGLLHNPPVVPPDENHNSHLADWV
jgi:hypothetical protein